MGQSPGPSLHPADGLAAPLEHRRQSHPPVHSQTLGKDECFQGILQSDFAQVRRVQAGGWMSFSGRQLRVPEDLHGQLVALRPTLTDGR